MPKISVNILTKNRKNFLKIAMDSVFRQSFKNVEIIVVNDGSTDATKNYLQTLNDLNIQTINHAESVGITQSRQEALEASSGEYVALLDDDDKWIDLEKLAKQIKYLDDHPEVVLVGGGIQISKQISNIQYPISKNRPEADGQIRSWMLFKNPFFTSTVMFRREEAIKAGGFIKDESDLAEDYDLWLRMGKLGKMYNFQEVFTLYAKSNYNKEKLLKFYRKQLYLINKHKKNYPLYWLASFILNIRLQVLNILHA